MLFDLSHSLYITISTILTIALLIVCHFCVKTQKTKDIVLKISAVLTVIIHFSSLYIDYFKTGSAKIETTMFLPIYPCNVAMWLLVISAFCKNKKSKIFAYLGEFTFYLGVVGGIVGILFNEIYSSNPNLLDYGVLKGLLSHSTMLFGCIYLLVGGYIKIRVKNVASVFLGLLLLLVDGGIIIGIHRLANLEPPNSMYLLNSPFAGLPWINTATIGIASLMLVFIITTIVEQLTLKREERWYMQLRNYKKEKKINE